MATVLSYLDSDEKGRAPMTKEETEMFMKCFFLDKTKPDSVLDEKMSEELGFLGQVMYKRLSWQPDGRVVQVSPGAAIFAMILSKGIVGNAVMWAYTLNRMYNMKKSRVTLEDLTVAFPWGFPTEEEYGRLWDAQKAYKHGLEGDNLVDQPETWVLDPVS